MSYSQEAVALLTAVWEAAGYPWSMRLKVSLPLWMPWNRKRFGVRPEMERQLMRMSARQMDRRLKAALIRVYVTLLAASQQLYDNYGTQADPWMTLVGYFNAMQELGGIRRLVDDDVRTHLQETDRRGLAKRRTPHLEELTSRRASTDIPQVLELLADRARVENPFLKERAAVKKNYQRKARKSNREFEVVGGQESLNFPVSSHLYSYPIPISIPFLALLVCLMGGTGTESIFTAHGCDIKLSHSLWTKNSGWSGPTKR